jgi:integrase
MDSAHKDRKTGLWYVRYDKKSSDGKRHRSTKRGFKTKREAELWRAEQEKKTTDDYFLEMTWTEYVDGEYLPDIKYRVKESTMDTKVNILDTKLRPFFGGMRMCDITPRIVRKFYSTCILNTNMSETYKRTIHTQNTAIFNHACEFNGLKENPCRKAGTIGKKKAEEMNFLTREEFERFREVIVDNIHSYLATTMLFEGGFRIGELLCLEKKDINLETGEVSVSKTLYRDKQGNEKSTKPKTPQAVRIVKMPDYVRVLCADYIARKYGIKEGDRIFIFSKSFLEREMARGFKESGVKKIRIHDWRHSHAAELIEIGASPSVLAARLGHSDGAFSLAQYGHLYPNKQDEIAKHLQANHERNDKCPD